MVGSVTPLGDGRTNPPLWPTYLYQSVLLYTLYCIVLFSSIYIAPLNSHRQTEALILTAKNNSTCAESYFQKLITFWLPLFLGSFPSFVSSYLRECGPIPTEP